MANQERKIRPIRDTFIFVICTAILTSWLPVPVATVICFMVMGLVLFMWANQKIEGLKRGSKSRHPASKLIDNGQ